MPRVAIYPGSFDPVTYGHLDVLQRALAIFDKVILGIAININKKGLFAAEERGEMLRELMADEPRVEVDIFSSLLVEYAASRGADTIVRGLRAVADFEYEFQLALMNRTLAPNVDTVFLMTDENHFFVSSSLVREVARLGGDVGAFVPKKVAEALKEKLKGMAPPKM